MATAADAIEMQWKKEATEDQKEFYRKFWHREWYKIGKEKQTILLQKVGLGVYGVPPKKPEGSNKLTGYEDKQLEHIEDICKQLNKINANNSSKDISFSCIKVTCKTPNDKFTLPVFKTKITTDSSAVYFVDSYCRVYSSWRDYLGNNILPECMYCYPPDGCYSADTNGNILLDFGTSPACKPFNKIVSALDTVSTFPIYGTVAVSVAAIASIPIAGPIVSGVTVASATSGLYAAGRSTARLVDRNKHKQSIGLDNRESVGCWLNIAGVALGAGQKLLKKSMISAMKTSFRSGEVMGKSSICTFNIVNAGCIAVNGSAILYKVYAFIKGDCKELTTLDIFQFTAACLLFLHAVINADSAMDIILTARRDSIAQQNDDVNLNAEKCVNGLEENLKGLDLMLKKKLN